MSIASEAALLRGDEARHIHALRPLRLGNHPELRHDPVDQRRWCHVEDRIPHLDALRRHALPERVRHLAINKPVLARQIPCSSWLLLHEASETFIDHQRFCETIRFS